MRIHIFLISALLIFCIHPIDVTDLPGVLFVFDSWNSDTGGLVSFHKVLVKDFAARKKGQLDIYVTTMDLEKHNRQREKELEKLNIKLIYPTINKRLSKRVPDVDWLINHPCYFPDVKNLSSIISVVGYAPKTADAAAEIHHNLFENATLLLINHLIPNTEYPHSLRNNDESDMKMLSWAAEADILFSIGPGMYSHFQNAYRAGLYEKPHKEYLPRPDDLFFRKKIILSKSTDKHVLLTYGEVDELTAKCIARTLATVLNDIGNETKKMKKNEYLAWKIIGIMDDYNEINELFHHEIRGLGLKFSSERTMSFEDLATKMQQSHICLIAACYEGFSFDGLEAMAIGLPVLVSEDSEVAKYMSEYFKEYKSTRVVEDNIASWSKGIINVLDDLPTAFKSAEGLRESLNASESISKSHGKFAAVLEPKKKLRDKLVSFSVENYGLQVNINIKECVCDEWQPDGNGENENFPVNQKNQEKQTVSATQGARLKKQIARDCLKEICQYAYKDIENKVKSIKRDDDDWTRLREICQSCFANLEDVSVGSVHLILTFTHLYDLFKFEGYCRSGKFASLLEQVLITNDMREKFAKHDLSLQLAVSYNQDAFEDIEDHLVHRDGGLREFDWYEESEDDQCDGSCEPIIDASEQHNDKPEMDYCTVPWSHCYIRETLFSGRNKDSRGLDGPRQSGDDEGNNDRDEPLTNSIENCKVRPEMRDPAAKSTGANVVITEEESSVSKISTDPTAPSSSSHGHSTKGTVFKRCGPQRFKLKTAQRRHPRCFDCSSYNHST